MAVLSKGQCVTFCLCFAAEGEEAKKLTCFLCNTFTPGKEDDGKMCKDEWNKTIEAEVQTCEGTVCRKYIQKGKLRAQNPDGSCLFSH